MSRDNSSSSSARRGSSKAGPGRIDVSSAPASLRQSPFAALSGLSSPAAADPPLAGSTAPTENPAKQSQPRSRGRLLLRRETKHRGGKTVVVISGFSALRDRSEKTLHEIEKHIKSRLGCGGSTDVERAEVLIQGDRPDAIADLLRALGYDVAGVTASPKGGRTSL